MLARVVSSGQSLNSVNYSEKEGLPSSTVYHITQDKDGYLWFATENGLSRFDGTKFTNLTTKEGLPDNSILQVHATEDGRLYFLPFTHTIYYYQDGTINKLPVPEEYTNDVSQSSHFSATFAGTVFASQGKGYIIRGDSIIPLTRFFDIPADFKLAMAYDSVFICMTTDSVYFISPLKIVRTKNKTKQNTIYSKNMKRLALFQDEKKNIYVGDFANSEKTIFFGYYNNFVHFFSTETGALLYKIKVDKFSNAYIDNENNLWISTLDKGVYRFLPFNFRQIIDEQNGIYSIAYWNKKIYAGSDMSQLYSLRDEPGSGIPVIDDLSAYIAHSENHIALASKRNRVYTQFQHENYLLVGADAFLLKIETNRKKTFTPIFPVKDIDVSGNDLLLCTGKAAFVLDIETLSIKDTLLQKRTTSGVIYNGNYYLSTLGGLIKINAKTKAITELYKTLPQLKGRIAAIKKGKNNDLWIASNGQGLIHFKDDRIIKTLTEEDGLTNDICSSLFIDSNTVWLGTSRGLNRIENAAGNEVITRITTANGLPSDMINSVYIVDQSVYIGSPKGLTCFDKEIFLEKSICLLHIQQILLNGKKLPKDSSYTFSHNALNIQISFAAISFKSAGDISYYYKLTGLEDDWNLTTDNYVNFATLPPGDYTFEVKAINKFGIASSIQSVDITILPAWWQTWLFKIIIAVLSIAAITVLYRRKITSYKRKEEEKRKIEARYAELEQQALLAQMNPHFIFNCLNSIQSFVIAHDVIGANQYITSFSSLIRQTLENSSNTFISLQAEIRYLTTYLRLEQLRFKDKFTFSITAEETIQQSGVYLPSMLIQPYVENALRHGIAHRKDNLGHVSIEIIKQADNSYLYLIKDNGVGREQAEQLKSKRHIEYQSKGTRISANRIASINSQYKQHISAETTDIVENGMIAGTCIKIIIPNFIENNG